MPSAKSGGKRAGEKRRQQKAVDAESRSPNYSAQTRAQFRRARSKLKGGAGDLLEGIAFLRVAMRQAADDPGLPPEHRREQVARFAAALIKGADAKKLNEELGAELREAHDVILAMKGRPRAAQEPEGDPAGPSSTPH